MNCESFSLEMFTSLNCSCFCIFFFFSWVFQSITVFFFWHLLFSFSLVLVLSFQSPIVVWICEGENNFYYGRINIREMKEKVNPKIFSKLLSRGF